MTVEMKRNMSKTKGHSKEGNSFSSCPCAGAELQSGDDGAGAGSASSGFSNRNSIWHLYNRPLCRYASNG